MTGLLLGPPRREAARVCRACRTTSRDRQFVGPDLCVECQRSGLFLTSHQEHELARIRMLYPDAAVRTIGPLAAIIVIGQVYVDIPVEP
jgi:hypothetical protein